MVYSNKMFFVLFTNIKIQALLIAGSKEIWGSNLARSIEFLLV